MSDAPGSILATSAEPEAVGLVGLGLVGRALATRLQIAGYAVHGWDHAAPANEAWVRAGHRLAPSLAALTALQPQGIAVVLAVYDTAGVRQVLEGPDGLLAAGSPTVVVDCSTGDPDALAALGTRLAARGTAFIEAPLSGSSQQIAEGQATMLIGATPEAVAAHGRLLAALSPQRVVVGGPGMGARAKLATNLVLGLNRAALAEGLVFAERLGIDPATFLQLVLATPARSHAALAKGERMVRGDFAPQSRIRQHLKDVELMQAQARAAGQHLPLTAAHAALLQAAVEAGDGELDNAAIVRQLRRETLRGR
jgi:3-hydroxyisobutyrate dehydrogenase-like beta-hydroxyacid dehydrogenase